MTAYYCLLIALFPALIAGVSRSDLKADCDTVESQGCFMAALGGLCNGKSKETTNKMWETCPCSCTTVSNERLLECCTTVGPPDRPECAPLCSHRITAEDLRNPDNRQCFDILHVLTYCGLEGRDESACCLKQGLSEKCADLCRSGYSPSICGENVDDYYECLDEDGLSKIRYCYLRTLSKSAEWDETWKATCPLNENSISSENKNNRIDKQ